MASIVSSLRGLQQASELKNVQKKLGCARASLGSLSEAASVFDPECLKEIVGELAGQLERHRDPNVLRDHRLHADCAVDRSPADEANLRN
ncbi:MAG: hypothetical protein ABGZ23_16670, partial [Fuerstiella sp.]